MDTDPNKSTTVNISLPSALASALVFLASGAVLVLEVVGLRLVAPYLGVTLRTSSAVIGVALAAIAYGVWTGGWLADRVDPRRLLAPALVLAGAATAVTLPLVRWAGEPLRGSASAGILALTAIAVFGPAALLSAVTPLVVKLQLGDLGRTGRVVGTLSGVGTLGAITATIGTGFVLVAALPTSTILLGLAGLLAAAGLGVGAYLWRVAPTAPGLPDRIRTMIAVVGLAGAGLTTVAPDPCDVETAYHCARVETDPLHSTGRVLLLNSAPHSYVDLANPRYLGYEYTRWIGAFIDSVAPAGAPLRTLHLGGGGFTLPRYLSATRPGSTNLVLELDGQLVDLDRQRLGLVPGPDLQIWVGDARVGVSRQPVGGYDLVIGDAFGHLVVPWHLTTRELVADVSRVLRPGGAYALNVIDYPPGRFVRAQVATIMDVFAHVALVAPVGAIAGRFGSNFVILASDAPLDLTALVDYLSILDNPVRVIEGADLVGFAGHAPVLTDDFAPVDQLLGRG